MRPPELWGTDPSESGPSDKKARHDIHQSPGVRSSPRFRRQSSDNHPNPIAQAVFESPRKRQRSGKGPVPQPSPRMATRSSTRTDGIHIDGHDLFGAASAASLAASANAHAGINGELTVSSTEMDNPFIFSPTTMFATSPIRPGEASAAGQALSNLLGAIPEGSGTAGEEQVDIDALLAQISSDQNFSLDSLLSEGIEGEGDADLMEFLGQWNDTAGAEGLGDLAANGPNGTTAPQ